MSFYSIHNADSSLLQIIMKYEQEKGDFVCCCIDSAYLMLLISNKFYNAKTQSIKEKYPYNIQQYKSADKLMTTITNFLHSTFLDSPLHSDTVTGNNEKPIWVINGEVKNKINVIKQYVIDHFNANNSKLLVRVDFGVVVFREIRDCSRVVKEEGGLVVGVVGQDKPYILISVRSQLRSQASKCFSLILQTLTNLNSSISQYIPKTTQKCSFSLLLQNLEYMSPSIINQSTKDQRQQNLQYFINHLTSLPSVYKQISIFKYSFNNILLPQHQFALERISTCLTEILGYEKGVWMARSTVRRYNGYSNQEHYAISFGNSGRLKVDKMVAKQGEEETEAQKQMISQLGFVVKKGQQSQKSEDLKQMIYPHLRVQNETHKCTKSECKTCNCDKIRPEDEGLIILDDQQEDDDDIDV